MSGMSTFSGETLITKPGSREESIRAVTAVLRRIPDPADQRAVLEALFAEGRRRPPRGFKGERPERETYVPCGSSAAYQRHRRRGEPIDDACRKANSQSEMARRAQRRAEKEAAR